MSLFLPAMVDQVLQSMLRPDSLPPHPPARPGERRFHQDMMSSNW
jgi:hypothetical protein